MYHNVDEFETAIANFATAHPTIAERITLPEQSLELRRTVSCLRIGSKAAGAVAGALIICGQHAREWVPPEIGLNFIADVISAYVNDHPLAYGNQTYTAAQIREIVDSINIFVVPCVNPDGNAFTHAAPDVLHTNWRRNRNLSYDPQPHCQGVDLNRNYDFVFDLKKYFDLPNPQVTDNTSDEPCHFRQVYQGPKPFSEPETRNICWLLDTYRRIRWFIDIHSYRSEIYHPWGDDENQDDKPAMNWQNDDFDQKRGRPGATNYREYLSPRDTAAHKWLARRLGEGIQPVNGRSYLVTQIFTLYPTAGSATDWVWSRHLVDPSKPRIKSFAIEVRGSGFQPPLSEKDEVVREVTSGLINFCLATVSAGLLFYKRSAGEGLFVSTDDSGDIAELQQHTNWDRNWDLIVPGNFGGSDHTGLLFYKRSAGEGLFVSTHGNGNFQTLQQHTNWDKDWDLIIPGNFDGSGYTGLLLYKRSTGEGLFLTSDGTGNPLPLQQLTWDKDWDLIVPGNFAGSGYTDLLFYKRSTGEGLFLTSDGTGNPEPLQQHTNWDKDWDLIISGNFGGSGYTDLLFYKRSTGEGLFVTSDGTGNPVTLQQHTNWDRDWDLIIPGNFGMSNYTGLLFYKRSTGEGLFVTSDGTGNPVTLLQHTDWDRDWDLIIPGNFGS